MRIQTRQRGFTLIEAMVALLLLSIGLLGIAATLIAALQSSSSNYLRQQGVQYAYDVIERMRSNLLVSRNSTSGNPYITTTSATASASTPSPNCTTSACSGASMAAWDIWEWKTSLQNNLPGGVGSVAVMPSGTNTQVTVTVLWNDAPAQAIFNPGASTTGTYTVVTLL